MEHDKKMEGEIKEYEQKLKEEYEQAKKAVANILATDEEARNNDLWLIYRVWTHEQGIKVFIPFDEFQRLFSFETIRRTRQKFNEAGQYLPTDKSVMVRRRLKEKFLTHFMSLRSNEEDQTQNKV
jgi:hypothetical protein